MIIARDNIVDIDDQLAASKGRVERSVTASGTCLIDISGVGPIVAATIIGYTRDCRGKGCQLR